jgi:diaminopimelate decarboxylase
MKSVPLSKEVLSRALDKFPTPFYIYSESGIRGAARDLMRAFSWAPSFKEYFAVKATPNPYILAVLKEEGAGADCSSLTELILSERVGMRGEQIMFTSNDTPLTEFVKAKELGAVINLDDFGHIDFIEKNIGLPSLVFLRYNPGSLKAGNEIIGNPLESKFGMTREQIIEGLMRLKAKGVKRLGLHIMVASNELDPNYFADTAGVMFDLAVELNKNQGIRLEAINLGGGIGVNYRPDQAAVDPGLVGGLIRQKYEEKIVKNNLHPIKIFIEMGRVITAPYGVLVARVLHVKKTYKNFVGLDATMANLMRPALYGAYHHITVLGKEDQPCTEKYDVVGSLCENNDKFAVDRLLPALEPGDVLIIHDAGAHGHAMGFNYNGKLRSAELLLRTDGSVQEIRRAETVDDYFKTIDFSGLSQA